MKKVTVFYMQGCPYCIKAKKAVEELRSEDPKYGEVEIGWVDENKESEMASQYDYYYVPTVFYGKDKLYEAKPSESYEDIKGKMKEALDTVWGK